MKNLLAATGAAGLCLCVAVTSPVKAQLSPEDSTTLTYHLQILSEGWVEPSVGPALDILTRSSYDASDWEYFFRAYFSTYPFTEDLRVYLGYPTFYWYGDDVHARLQRGMFTAITEKIDSLMATFAPELGATLGSDLQVRESLFVSHRFLNSFCGGRHDSVALEPFPSENFEYYKSHIGRYPEFFEKSTTLDTGALPFVGALRLQVYNNFKESLPLTVSVKSQIAGTLGLSGLYWTIFDDHNVLVMDNNGLDAEQLAVIRSLLGAVPGSLHSLTGVSVIDLLGGSPPGLPPAGVAVNIFPTGVGVVAGNPFPQDVEPRYVDSFFEVLVHEVNHAVDFFQNVADPSYGEKVRALVTAAGSPSLNYLRSMFADGFFQDAPQEFFASIANQWFTDSEHTLRLGRVRFDAERPHPLDQALFFAEVYSLGGDSTRLYSTDTQANIQLQSTSVRRDARGFIDRIAIGDSIFTFVRDAQGDVQSYTASTCALEFGLLYGDTNGDGTVSATDAEEIARYIVGLSVGNPARVAQAGDVSGDGETNVIDARQIARFAAGLETIGRVNQCILDGG